jgi:uncharacterized small protein (DUF1192 family)
MNFIVAPKEQPKIGEQEYEIKHLKTAETADGQTVEIVERAETVTISQLDERIELLDRDIARLEEERDGVVAIKHEIEGQA